MNALRTAVACVALVLMTTPSFAQGGEEVVYFHADAIGSVRLVTDASGAVVERYDYLPFGEPYPPSAPVVETRRFGGKERDAETGLDYFGARYYASGNGRFTTVDPMLGVEEALVDPQRWNRYAYVRNNPFRFVDPDGRDIWDTLAGLGNAFSSNFVLRARGSGNSDYRFGQFIGDLASVPAGLAWANGGISLAGAGILGAPESGGATLVVTVAGAAVTAQGLTASGQGLINAGVFLSQNTTENQKPDIRPTKAEKNTPQGALDQLEGVSNQQRVHRKAGQPDRINRITKSEKRVDHQNKKVKNLEDAEDSFGDIEEP